MGRMASRRLTLVLLQEEIPVIRDGEAASARLGKATRRMSDTTRAGLQRKVRAGDIAKERLFDAALPLIRTVATREWHRRRQWGSQVLLEDLIQEAIIGFLKGISSFRMEAVGRSATNYLGQWMLVETRRAAEVLDHDLQVGHDAGERFRRVVALRNRLASELDHDPTDEEISAASRNPYYITRPGLVGRAPKDGEERQPGKGLTIAQITEERSLRTRVGRVDRFSTSDDNDESSTGPGLVDPSRATSTLYPLGETLEGPEEQVLAADRARVVAGLLTAAMDRLALPSEQRDIVSRRFGLPPHVESSAREISRELGIQRDRVSRVLSAFQQEMVRPGGSFHAVIQGIEPDDLRDLGLGWVVDTLGDWPDHPSDPPPVVLLESLPPAPKRRMTAPGTTRAEGFLAWYMCDFHDRAFYSLYQERADAPKKRPCPSCQRICERFKLVPAG
jgi:RNA polymerase sigma factor (sigma-70 family)